MTSKKVNFIMIGTVAVLTLGSIGLTVLGDKLLQKEAAKLVEVKLENAVLEAEQDALARAHSDLEKYQDLYEITKQIVPSDKNQAQATREIIGLAEQSRIKISGISFPTSKLGDKPIAPVPAPAPTDGSEPVAPVTPIAPPSSSVSQAEPVKGIPGLSQLEINVVSAPENPVSYEQLISFLQRLENNRRTAQVSGLTILPSQLDNSLITFTLTITVYIKS